MNFEFSPKVQDLRERLQAFMDEHVYPNEALYLKQHAAGDPWEPAKIIDELKDRAKEAGLWNLFLPREYGEFSPGLTVLEYAPLAEIMGRVLWASEVFNCSAPDTGNMEVLARYGNSAQQKEWLLPLLDGEIRSAFAMTEPEVASSDATNVQTSIVRDGDDYVINGCKWYISGACNNRTKIMIVMGKTDPDGENRYMQQSMVLVPMEAEGVTVVRPMKVFGYDDAPEGHAELTLDNVRVPVSNLLLGKVAVSKSRRDGWVLEESTIVCGSSEWHSGHLKRCVFEQKPESRLANRSASSSLSGKILPSLPAK